MAEFGYETDTLDDEGQTVATTDNVDISIADVSAVAAQFVGEIKQTPPLYSAVKYQGKPLYRHARSGMPVPLASLQRQVRVQALQVLSLQDRCLRFSVTCGKGMYVRSLVRDMALALGSLATVKDIIRTAAYGMASDVALPLTAITADNLPAKMLPISSLPLPRLSIACAQTMVRLQNGQIIDYDGRLYRFQSYDTPVYPEKFFLIGNSGSVFGIGTFTCAQEGECRGFRMVRGLL